jgi:hypothetical protein
LIVHPNFPSQSIIHKIAETLEQLPRPPLPPQLYEPFLVKQGLERLEVFNIPHIHHRGIQFQQQVTQQLRFPEKLLFSYFNKYLGDAQSSILQQSGLPKSLLESHRRLAVELLEWCKSEMNTSYYQALLGRFRTELLGWVEKPNESIEYRRRGSDIPAAHHLFRKFIGDPKQWAKTPSEFFSRMLSLPSSPGEADLSEETSSPSPPPKNLENPTSFESFHSHPYILPPEGTRTHSKSHQNLIRFGWCDLEVPLLDELDRNLRKFLHQLIGNAFLVAQERLRVQSQLSSHTYVRL